jgi:hypothetical protein
MHLSSTQTVMLLGGNKPGLSHSTQTQGEALTTGTLRATIPVDREHGHWSCHLVVTGTPTGTAKFFYSNLPFPALDNDAHWVEDTTKAVTYSGSAKSDFVRGVNQVSTHLRLVVNMTGGSSSVVAWAFQGG